MDVFAARVGLQLVVHGWISKIQVLSFRCQSASSVVHIGHNVMSQAYSYFSLSLERLGKTGSMRKSVNGTYRFMTSSYPSPLAAQAFSESVPECLYTAQRNRLTRHASFHSPAKSPQYIFFIVRASNAFEPSPPRLHPLQFVRPSCQVVGADQDFLSGRSFEQPASQILVLPRWVDYRHEDSELSWLFGWHALKSTPHPVFQRVQNCFGCRSCALRPAQLFSSLCWIKPGHAEGRVVQWCDFRHISWPISVV